jgi:tetratricopeptide (TPR) repeat protein
MTAPDAARSLQATAEAALREGDLAVAKKNIEKAADQYRESGSRRRLANAQVLQGNIARAAGDLDSAERHFRAALTTFFLLDDRYSAAHLLSAIAELHFIEGDYAEAADLNRQAVERMPGDVNALTGLAYAQWRAGSPADAQATFHQVLHWDPNTPLALAGRGQIRADLGQYEYALDDLDRALALQLNRDAEVDVRSARALALAGLGRVSEAEDELAMTMRIDPERPRTRLRAGRIAAILGHQEQMREELERALAGRPSLSSVEQESARRILQRLGSVSPPASLANSISCWFSSRSQKRRNSAFGLQRTPKPGGGGPRQRLGAGGPAV